MAQHGYTVFSGISRDSDASNGLGIAVNSARLFQSVRTFANVSSMTAGDVGVVMQASGLSLIYVSANTAYTLGASAVSAAWS